MTKTVTAKATSNLSQVLVVGGSANVALSELADGAETVLNAVIKKAIFSGRWTVARGNTTVLNVNGTDTYDFAGEAFSMNYEANTKFVITDGSSGAGMLLLQIEKNTVV